MSDAGGADPASVSTSAPPPGYVAQPLEQPASPPANRNRSKLIAGIAAIVVLAGLGFLFLGSSDTQLSGPIAQAATLSSSTPGYRMHMAIEMTSPALTSPITVEANGVADVRDHATSMVLVMNLGDQPQVIQQLGGSQMRMEMITHGTVVYAKLPHALTAALSASGRPWIKVDLATLSGLPGLSSLVSNPTTGDPSHVLQSLRSVSDSVVNAGPQRVDGIATTHYRAELSLAHLADGIPQSQRSAATAAFAALQQALPTGKLPVDVWIDGRHLVRRALMILQLNLPNRPAMQEAVTIDFSDYGPKSAPATPPSDQVLNLNGLPGAGG